MSKNMPQVIECDAMDCVYNKNSKCHTFAINVGGKEEPCCDTYMMEDSKAGFEDIIGGVGSCKTTNCEFNDNFECTTSAGIMVHAASDHPDCSTYQQM